MKARSIAAHALDGYVNSYYRALKNARVGLDAEAHLDTAESVGPLLTALFAIHGRVRPFNKFLGWELEHFPLADEMLAHHTLLPRLREIVAHAGADEQASLFRDVDQIARRHELGEVIDSWQPDVDWLRTGGSPT